ncbi:hypothetical protein PMAYCL1PPCAC_24188 [Pristionchus mayeri]|uniref:Uncharacterized protein n=1 Tax=Pristionchus mayeri TaxID=1317129 RepID=A0AAN5D010_9BILA|nr:hypothetical protein PMAYCL1PPCAC_24188 [Pristionchus mayeri]
MLSEFPLPDEADLYHATRDGQKNMFDEGKKKPQVSYRGDGRKEIDGILQEAQGANALWTTTISRGVAHQWKDKSEGRMARAQRYIADATYEVKVYIRQNRHVSIVALVILNLFLVYILYRLL